MTAGVVAVRAVGRLIDLGVAAGIPRGVLMKAADVTDDNLRDPDAHLPLAGEIALWQALSKQVADPGFGIRGGSTVRIRQLGLLGYVVCFSATLRDALRRLGRYGRVFTEAVQFEFREEQGCAALVTCHPALGAGQPLAQDYRLAAVVQVSREITGVHLIPMEVNFTYPQPSSVVAHRRFFGGPIRFNARTARIVFRAADLDLRQLKGDETLAGYLSKYAERVLASLVQGGTLRHTVRAVVWSLLGDGLPSLERVAAALRMPPRTLQRHMAAEGTSLQAEIEQIRKTMALAVLRDRSISIDDVAFLLGYAEPSTFFRAFKRWTGTTPRRFRAAA